MKMITKDKNIGLRAELMKYAGNTMVINVLFFIILFEYRQFQIKRNLDFLNTKVNITSEIREIILKRNNFEWMLMLCIVIIINLFLIHRFQKNIDKEEDGL